MSTLSVCKNTQWNQITGWVQKQLILYTYTLSVKVHSVCVKIHSVIKSPFTHTKCTFTLSVYVYRMCCFYTHPVIYYTVFFYTHRVYFYTQCIRIQNVLFLHPSRDFITLFIFTLTECTQCVVLHTVGNYKMYIHTW